MAVTITRGFSFASNSIVDATALNDLVQRASIAGLTLSDFGAAVAWSSTDTAPTNCPVGWITHIHDGPYVAAPETGGQEPTFVIRDGLYASSYTLADVALLHPLRLESKRFVYSTTADICLAFAPAYRSFPTGDVAATLSSSYSTNFLDSLAGPFLGTSYSHATNPHQFRNHRNVVVGLGPIWAGAFGATTTAQCNWMPRRGASQNVFNAASTGTVDFTYALGLFRGGIYVPNNSRWAWFFGGPIWSTT